MTPLQERFKEAIDFYDEDSVRFGKQGIAIACEKIAEEFAEKFAEWIDDSEWTHHPLHKLWVGYDPTKRKTTHDLLQQFKDERK